MYQNLTRLKLKNLLYYIIIIVSCVFGSIIGINKKIDNAIFNGVDKPADWREGLIPSIVAAGKEVTETGELYSDINEIDDW